MTKAARSIKLFLSKNSDAQVLFICLLERNAENSAIFCEGRNSGKLHCDENEKIWVQAPLIKVRSTVGAGDSMVAGMVSVLLKNGTYKEILQMGVACGSATTMATGTGLFRKEDVDYLFQMISNQKII